MIPGYTPEAAASVLDRMAEEAQDENYHTSAAGLWALRDQVLKIKERTSVMIATDYTMERGGVVTFIVQSVS